MSNRKSESTLLRLRVRCGQALKSLLRATVDELCKVGNSGQVWVYLNRDRVKDTIFRSEIQMKNSLIKQLDS